MLGITVIINCRYYGNLQKFQLKKFPTKIFHIREVILCAGIKANINNTKILDRILNDYIIDG